MIFLDEVKSYNTIKALLLYKIAVAKEQMLNKPYIHYIDIKIMNKYLQQQIKQNHKILAPA
jgi:hypothetical protein